MWLLYRLKTNPKNIAEVRYHLISRLRPGNEYKIFAKGHEDEGAIVKVYPMSEEQVCNPNSRYEVYLKQKEGSTEVLVGQKSVNKNQILFQDDILRLSNSDVRYKIMWQDVVFLKEGPEDDDYMNLMISGAEWGFNVVRKLNKLITHIVIPESTQPNISLALLTALMKNIPVITMNWINHAFMKTDDRKFNMSPLNAAIQPVVWKEFGPLQKDVIFDGNASRNKLFENMNFIVLDQWQYSALKFIIEACQGTLVYHDLDSDEDLEMNHNSIVIAPNEQLQSHEKYHSLIQEFRDKTASEREIDESEIGYAILYESTNYMCNPCATFSSLNLPSAGTTAAQATVPYSGPSFDSDEDADIKMEQFSQPATEEAYETAPDPAIADAAATAATADPSLQYIETRTSAANNNDEQEDYQTKDVFNSHRSTCSINAANLEEPTGRNVMTSTEEEDEPEEENLSPLMGNMSDFFEDFANMGERKPPPSKKKITITTTNNALSAPPPAATSPPLQPQPSNGAESSEFNLPPDPIAYTPYIRLTQTRREDSVVPLYSPTPLPAQAPSPARAKIATPQAIPITTTAKRRRIQNDDEANEDDSHDKHMSDSEDNVSPPIPETNQKPSPLQPTEEGSEKYIKYAFVPLVVNPRPSASSAAAAAAASRRSTGGVNYKKFKKVRQFTYHNVMDIVYLVPGSQRQSTQRNNNDNFQRFTAQLQGIRLQETNEFDPELMIRTSRRR